MTLFTNLRLLREMNLDIKLQAFQMPMLGLKPKVLIQRFHLRHFCLKTTSHTWLTKYSQTYFLFLPFFYFIEICIQKSVFLPQMYSSMSLFYNLNTCVFDAKIKKQHHLALELSHSLVRILCFPLQTMLRIRLKKKKNCLCLHTFIYLETNHRHTTWEGTGKRHSISFLKLVSEDRHSHGWYNVQSRPLGRQRYSSWNPRMESVHGSLYFGDYLLVFSFPTGIR